MNSKFKLFFVSGLMLSFIASCGNLKVSNSDKIIESALDFSNTTNTMELRNTIGGVSEIKTSPLFVQCGVSEGVEVLRYAIAVQGDINSISFNRAEFKDALGNEVSANDVDVSVVYAGILQDESGIPYYYTDEGILSADENDKGNYYWACYTIAYTTDDYKDIGMNVNVKINGEEINSRVASLNQTDWLSQTRITTIQAADMTLKGSGSLNANGYWGSASDGTYYTMTYDAPYDVENMAIGLDLANGNAHNKKMTKCQLNYTVSIFVDDIEVPIADDVLLKTNNDYDWENFEQDIVGFVSLKKGTHTIRYQVKNLTDIPESVRADYNTWNHIAAHNFRSLSMIHIADIHSLSNKNVIDTDALTAEEVAANVNVYVKANEIDYRIFPSSLNFNSISLELGTKGETLISMKNASYINTYHLFTHESITCDNLDLLVRDNRVWYMVEGTCNVEDKASISFIDNNYELMGCAQNIEVSGNRYVAYIDVTDIPFEWSETISGQELLIGRDAPHLYVSGYPVDNQYGDIKLTNKSGGYHYSVSSLVFNNLRYSLSLKSSIPYIVIEEMDSVSVGLPNITNDKWAVARNARVEIVDNKVYYYLTGYCYGLSESELNADLEGNTGAVYENVKFDDQIYRTYFEMRTEVTELGERTYYPHLLYCDKKVDAVDMLSSNMDSFVEFNGKIYKIGNNYQMPSLIISSL